MAYSKKSKGVAERDRGVRLRKAAVIAILVLIVLVGLVATLVWLLSLPVDDESDESPVRRSGEVVPFERSAPVRGEKPPIRFDYPYDFGEIFSDRANWRLSKEEFLVAFGRAPFQTSSSIESDLYAFSIGDMEYFREYVQEARVRFSSSRKSITRIELVLYGRGNGGGEMRWAEMQRIWERLPTLRSDPEFQTETEFREYDKRGRVDIARWFGEFPAVECWFGYKPVLKGDEWVVRPDFISLTMSPRRVLRFRRADHSPFVWRAKRDHDMFRKGDVYIRSIPMVDQGQRGYCSVATMERIMRYYGTDVGMHEFALLANSDPKRGTSGSELEAAVDCVARQFGMSWTQHVHRAERFDVAVALHCGNASYVRQERLADKTGFSNFTNDVIRSVVSGIPVHWSVSHLFATADDPLDEDHARLLVGYNESTQELIFSDTWGAQHEFRRKKMEDAWVMTISALSVDPSGRTDFPEDGELNDEKVNE